MSDSKSAIKYFAISVLLKDTGTIDLHLILLQSPESAHPTGQFRKTNIRSFLSLLGTHT
jgi:hypothetical protein